MTNKELLIQELLKMNSELFFRITNTVHSESYINDNYDLIVTKHKSNIISPQDEQNFRNKLRKKMLRHMSNLVNTQFIKFLNFACLYVYMRNILAITNINYVKNFTNNRSVLNWMENEV